MRKINDITQIELEEALLKVKEIIRNNANNFNMECFISTSNKDLEEDIFNFCDSVMCITGHLAVMFNPKETSITKLMTFAGNIANASKFDLDILVYDFPNYVTTEEACLAIDSYLLGSDDPWKSVRQIRRQQEKKEQSNG